MPIKTSQRTPADLYIIPCCPGQRSNIRASDNSYSPSGAILEPRIARIAYPKGNISCGSLSGESERPGEAVAI
jgi:hypothetical protein